MCPKILCTGMGIALKGARVVAVNMPVEEAEKGG
jgi:hypothetical protein